MKMNNKTIWITLANPMNIILLLLMIIFIRSLILAVVLNIRMKAAKRSPTQANAWRVYKTLCKFGIGIRNHPKVWGEYRDMFYKINQSPDVPSELKQKLKDRLIKKGLYINNTRIIDNYKG